MTTTTPLWADNPTHADLLGFRDIAMSIAEALLRDHLDPMALGVLGDWGSGKSSILEILQSDFEPDGAVLTVLTRPWEYDPRTDAKATLIAEVLDALQTEIKKDEDLFAKLQGQLARLRKRINWSKGLTLAANTAVTFQVPNLKNIIDVFSETPADEPEPSMQGFRDEFAALLGEVPHVKRVIVLVDDLDRCLPETVIASLEAIKLFLSVKKMGFVIAADERLVRHAVATKYQPAPQAEQMAREYLEKIIQIPIRVPALGLGDTEAYLAILLLERHTNDGDTWLPDLIAHCDDRRASAEQQVFDTPEAIPLPDDSAADIRLAKMLARVLAAKTGGNPRRLKRFLNAYWLRNSIASRRGVKLEPDAVAKLMVLEEMEPEQFSKLLDWVGDGSLIERLKALEVATETPKDELASLRQWAVTEPKLSDNGQLETYLRLAATLRSRPSPGHGLDLELAAIVDAFVGEKDQPRREALKAYAGRQREERVQVVTAFVDRLNQGSRDERRQGVKAVVDILADPDGTVVTLFGEELRKMDPSVIEPALVAVLEPKDTASRVAAIDQTLRHWLDSGQLPTESQALAQDALGDGQ
jgi:hypothetical protein